MKSVVFNLTDAFSSDTVTLTDSLERHLPRVLVKSVSANDNIARPLREHR